MTSDSTEDELLTYGEMLERRSPRQLQADYVKWRKAERHHEAEYRRLCEKTGWKLRRNIKKQVDEHVAEANSAQYKANEHMRVMHRRDIDVPEVD